MHCLWHQMTTGPLLRLLRGLQRQIAPSAFDLTIHVYLTNSKAQKYCVPLRPKTACWPQYDDLLSTREPGTLEVPMVDPVKWTRLDTCASAIGLDVVNVAHTSPKKTQYCYSSNTCFLLPFQFTFLKAANLDALPLPRRTRL